MIHSVKCDPKWSKIYANHTMCLNDVGTEVVLDAATKAQIVERHNQIRSNYGQNKEYRHRLDMAKMVSIFFVLFTFYF